MATGIFLTAAEARQNPLKSRTVFDEATAISSAVLESVKTGYYKAVVDGGTTMTQRTGTVNTVADINTATSTFTIGAHTLNTGDAIYVYSTGELPSPLQVNVLYFVIYVDADNIRLAATAKEAYAQRPISISLVNGVTSINLTNAGSGYTSNPSVTFSGGNAAVDATAVAYLADYGNISYIVVNTEGSGYHYLPTVSISAQGSGASAGNVTYKASSVSVNTAGQYYNIGDLLSIVGGSGTAATLKVTSIDINGGVQTATIYTAGNYATLPSLINAATTVIPGGGTGCTIDLNMGLNTIAVASGGSQYTAPPQVIISGGGGIDAEAYTVLTAGTVSNIIVSSSGHSYATTPTITITSGFGATAIPYLVPCGISSITLLSNGGNTYTVPPAVAIVPAGSGATVGTVSMRIVAATLTTGGAGSAYAVGDILIVAGGAGSDTATIRVNVVDSAGSIVDYTLLTSGAYTTLPVMVYNAVYGGSGQAASFDLTAGLGNVSISSGGSGYTAPPTVIIEPSDGNGIGANAYCLLDGSSVDSVVITSNGYGYTAIPDVTITPGSGATAQAVLTATGVDVVNMVTQGSGYTTATVNFISEIGTGAAATATISGGQVVSVIVTNPGFGYVTAPLIEIDGDGNGATAVAVLDATSVDYITVTALGSNYTSVPNVVVAGSATANVSLQGTGIQQIIVTSGGQYYSSDPQINVIPGAGESTTPIQPTTTVIRGFSIAYIDITNQGQGYDSVPTVTISAPSNLNGNLATATATIGYGTGTMSTSSYPPSRDYWLVWQNGDTANPNLTAPYTDNMLTVINYFTNLGYVITRQTNPDTNNTMQWLIRW